LILRFIGDNNKLDISTRFIYELERYPFALGKAVLGELEKMTNNITNDTSLGIVIHPDIIPIHARHEVRHPYYFEAYFKTFYWSRADTIEVVNINRISLDMYLDLVLDKQVLTKILERKVRNVL